MLKRIVSEVMLTLLFINMLTLTFNIQPVKSEPETWTVDDDGPANFRTIQEAIDAANDGDTIFVKNGTYYENIFVNKSISLIGENPKSTIIDGSNISSSFNPVIYVYGNNTKICNFTIRGSSNAWGIFLLTCENIWIENNLVTENQGGIVSDFSNNVTLIKNNITNNEYEGVLLFGASKNILKDNTISGNKYNFGVIEKFDQDIDTSNKIDGKTIYYLKDQKDLTINQNSFPDLGYLALINCTNVIVENLSIANNYNGLLLVETENSTVKNNSFQNNMRGIDIINSSNNTLEGNNVTDSGWIGISLVNSPNNTFKKNNLSNNELSFTVDGDSLNDFTQNLDLSNTVDGKLIRYLINCTDLIVNPSVFNDTGYLAFVNCYNITVEDLSLQNNELLFAFSYNFSIIRNNMSNGTIKVVYSSFVNLTENIILDGQSGILMRHSNNGRISENKITKNWGYGISLQESSFNKILYNKIRNNRIGISIQSSNNNTIMGNSISENEDYGILLTNSSSNKIFHNNFINNTRQAVCSFIPPITSNVWDNGYPSGGNYWSDCTGNDTYSGPYQNETGSDGLGDSLYVIDEYNVDRYPLMGPFNSFNTSIGYSVDVISNSTIEDFRYFESNSTIIMHVSNMTANQTVGFCRLTIPHELILPPYNITVNNTPVKYNTILENETLSIIYFSYQHSQIEIIIVPEYSSIIILLLTIVFATFAIILAKRKNTKEKTKSTTVTHSNFSLNLSYFLALTGLQPETFPYLDLTANYWSKEA